MSGPEGIDPGGRKLDGQWDPVELATDVADARRVRIPQLELVHVRRRALDEQLNGRKPERLGALIRTDADGLPSVDNRCTCSPSTPRVRGWLPGCACRVSLSEDGGEVGGSVDHMFTIIEHEQHFLVSARAATRLGTGL